MRVQAFDESGQPVLDQPGDLVCTAPFPCMPVKFWGDTDGQLYQRAYFSRFPGVWHHGDFVVLNSRTGGVVMLGRSDGTLNPSGVRFGSAEIYNLCMCLPPPASCSRLPVVVMDMPEIEDSLAISYKRVQDTDERLVLFVKLKEGAAALGPTWSQRSSCTSGRSCRRVTSLPLSCSVLMSRYTPQHAHLSPVPSTPPMEKRWRLP